MIERLSGKHVVLLGIGHTNAHVLRMWKMQAPPDTDLTCVSDNSIATYSGMLPAVLAQQIPPARMEIDLVQLCGSVGARLITDPVTGIDHSSRELQFEVRPPVPFDVLSIGIGSTASLENVQIDGDSLVLIKPMQTFLPRLRRAIEIAGKHTSSRRLKVAVVGSGVAGIEITCCLPAYVGQLTGEPPELKLVTRSDEIVPELEDRARRLIADVLDQRSVEIVTGRSVTRVDTSSIELDNGSSIGADVVIWATGAAPPPLLSKLGLALDERGFLATDQTLQSTSAQRVFAVGDTGTIVDFDGNGKLPKAGVYAVRQGPILWQNIEATLDGHPLQKYQPQRSFMKLVNLGDGRAVGQWKGLAFSGHWVKRLKDNIDTRFMDMFQVEPMAGDASDAMGGEVEMQCRGCGCKLGSDTLQAALEPTEGVAFDDAAEIGGFHGEATLVASTDFFSAPLDDAFTVGRIAALHSASDIIATGASVTDALANVVLPQGDRVSQQRVLRDLLRGARHEFAALGAPIVGGHTIVGPRMEIGFTVIGKPHGPQLLRKRNLRVGDSLFVTKPLGIGVLLAAQMRNRCPARAFDSLLEAMLQRQHALAKIAIDLGIDAATDVTGFGLIGHLIEMAEASQVSATIQLDQVPILPAASELVEEGIESSLVPENRSAESLVTAEASVRNRADYSILFDPQTCGGLLFGVQADRTSAFQAEIKAAGLPEPRLIGEVTQCRSDKTEITIQ